MLLCALCTRMALLSEELTQLFDNVGQLSNLAPISAANTASNVTTFSGAAVKIIRTMGLLAALVGEMG